MIDIRNILIYLLVILSSLVSIVSLISVCIRHENYKKHYHTEGECSNEIMFNRIYNSGKDIITRTSYEGIDFYGNGWAENYFCEPGELVLTASGRSALGEPPVLGVAINNKALRKINIPEGQETVLRFEIAEKSEVLLGFLNDISKADNRSILITLRSFAGEKCNTYSVRTSDKSGNTYLSPSKRIGMSDGLPVILSPCSSGLLRMTVSGLGAAGQMPVLVMSQNNHILYESYVSKFQKNISVNIEGSALFFILKNPHISPAYDRNLYIKKIEFIQGKEKR